MLISKSQKERLYHPTEEGAWVEIRPLSGVELDEASAAATRKVMTQFSGEAMAVMANANADRPERPETDKVRKGMYDPDILLGYAIVGWSEEAPITPDNVKLLDAQTRDWLWEEVVARNTRPPVVSKG